MILSLYFPVAVHQAELEGCLAKYVGSLHALESAAVMN